MSYYRLEACPDEEEGEDFASPELSRARPVDDGWTITPERRSPRVAEAIRRAEDTLHVARLVLVKMRYTGEARSLRAMARRHAELCRRAIEIVERAVGN